MRSDKIELRHIIGIRIRYYRELVRISQQDLASISGLNRSYIGGVERGERNMGIDNLSRIAAALGVEPWQLLRNDD